MTTPARAHCCIRRWHVEPEPITAAVLRLSAADRASLVARLLASLDDDVAERDSYEAAWEAELDRREAPAAADPSADIPAEDALAAIRAELSAARAGR